MQITRRDFLRFCGASAAALGLGVSELRRLEAALAGPHVPTLIWLHGSGCQGDSISFLNLFADLDPVGPVTAGGVLADKVSLAFHTVLMASAGQDAISLADLAQTAGGHVLVLEGGVPRAFEGRACVVGSAGGQEVTYEQAIARYGRGAKAVVCVGTCASYGGVPRSSQDPTEPNGPTDVVSGKQALQAAGVSVPLLVNVPGCPSHPAWIAWTIVQLILGHPIPLDSFDRPVTLFGNKTADANLMNIHENCPRNPNLPGNTYATAFGQDRRCLSDLGCRGPSTYADCPARQWNSGERGPANWCVDANAMCLGCVEPDFPNGPFYT